MKRQVIAILANYPIWDVDKRIPESLDHYAVWLTALSEALAHQDRYDIHWVTLHRGTAAPYSVQAKGQTFHFLPRTKRVLGLCTAYFAERRTMKKVLNTIKPDLVHAWGTEDCYGLAAKDIRGCKKLLSVQGFISAYKKYGKMPYFHLVHHLYESTILNAFEHITVESPWAQEQVSQVYPTADYILWDYAVEELFFSAQRNPSSTPVCLFAGSDTHVKNVPQLIHVFSTPELSHIELRLSGFPHGRYFDLPDNIKVVGRVSREEMKSEYEKAWCLVQPSLADTGPTVVKEARVVGLPVILTENCGSKQYVEEGLSGHIIPIHDDAALMKAVLHVCSSREQTLEMGLNRRYECRSALSSLQMYEKMFSIYSRLLDS